MALEYILTETITPEEYKNSFVNFYRQVLGMEGTYGDEGGGGGGDTFTPQQTTVSYSSADDNDEVNIDNFKIAAVDPSSVDSLPDLDLEGADKPDRLNTFEIGNNPTLRDKLLKNSDKLIQQGLPTMMGFTGGVPAIAATAGMTSFVGGSTYKDEAGNPQFRPDGILGVLGDFARQQRRDKLLAIQAGPSESGDIGTAFTVGNMMIVRGPGDMSYTGNRQGLSHRQLKNIEALQKGILPETFRFERDKDGRDAIFTGGRKVNQSIGADGGLLIDPNDPSKGFYRGDGAIYSLRFGYSPAGMMSDVERLAKNYGITTAQALDAIQGARAGRGTVSSNIKNLSDKSRIISTQRVGDDRLAPTVAGRASQLEAERERVAKLAREQAQKQRDDKPTKKTESAQDFTERKIKDFQSGNIRGGFNEGGFIGMNVGGLAASKSGFVDGVPPSQATDAQEVADDKEGKLPEGAFVINASAVTFAGEADIVDMLRQAQKEAVRRGVTADNPEASSMIDVAVSRGEVVVAPYLVNIIGKDRLEKINNRGVKDTERKIEENGQQTQGLFGGGFLGYMTGTGTLSPTVTSPQESYEAPSLPPHPVYTSDDNTYFGYRFGDIKTAIRPVEIQGFEEQPYIFTGVGAKGGKGSSAFGPMQITAGTLRDLKERSGDYQLFSDETKEYVDKLITQGRDKVNLELRNKAYMDTPTGRKEKPISAEDRSKLQGLKAGVIPLEEHEKFYSIVADATLKQKLLDHDTLEEALSSYGEGLEYASKVLKNLGVLQKN